MSHHSSIKIVCDWPRCYSLIDTRRPKLVEARTRAAEHGWKRVAGLVDLCGKEGDGPDSEGWRGHADRMDHVPVTKAAGRGDVHLSCVCGWVFVSPHAWRSPGTTSRDLAAHYWAQHVEAASVDSAPNPEAGRG
jgi:hypothetical protein